MKRSSERSVFAALQWLLLLGALVGIMWSPACTPTDKPQEKQEEQGGTKDAAPVDKGATCVVDRDCPDLAQNCQKGECTDITCSDDGDCRDKWVCRDNKCLDPAKAPCKEDTDCSFDPKLWKCDSGKCIDGGCRKDEDCTDPKLAACDVKTNKCVEKACVSDSDCRNSTDGPYCNKESGKCGPDTGVKEGESCDGKPCLRELSCYNDGGAKTCRKPCNIGSTTCKKPLECIPVTDPNHKAYCLDPGPGGKPGEDCADGKACQKHLKCVFTGKDETCRQPCGGDSDCNANSEFCFEHKDKKGVCLPKPDPCGPGRTCPGEIDGWQRCSNGKCLLLVCPDDIKCPVTHKCLPTGKCEPLKCPADACPELHKCSNDQCVRTNEGEKCGQGESIGINDCGDKLVCARVGYVSSCVRSCETDACPTGMTCETNLDGKKVCMQKCPAAPERCKYPGYFCSELKRTPKGNFCVPAGQPTGADEFQKCDSKTQCLPDLQCFSGFSSNGQGYCAPRCKTTADCSGNASAICTSYSGVGPVCMIKCPTNRFGSCTVLGISGYCYRSTSGTYICRPR